MASLQASFVYILYYLETNCQSPDVEDVKFVINFDFPNNSEDYVHRIGRTGRSKRTGTAYTFFTRSNAKQAGELVAVLKEANQTINPKLEDLADNYRGGFGRRRGGFRNRGGRKSRSRSPVRSRSRSPTPRRRSPRRRSPRRRSPRRASRSGSPHSPSGKFEKNSQSESDERKLAQALINIMGGPGADMGGQGASGDQDPVALGQKEAQPAQDLLPSDGMKTGSDSMNANADEGVISHQDEEPINKPTDHVNKQNLELIEREVAVPSKNKNSYNDVESNNQQEDVKPEAFVSDIWKNASESSEQAITGSRLQEASDQHIDSDQLKQESSQGSSKSNSNGGQQYSPKDLSNMQDSSKSAADSQNMPRNTNNTQQDPVKTVTNGPPRALTNGAPQEINRSVTNLPPQQESNRNVTRPLPEQQMHRTEGPPPQVHDPHHGMMGMPQQQANVMGMPPEHMRQMMMGGQQELTQHMGGHHGLPCQQMMNGPPQEQPRQVMMNGPQHDPNRMMNFQQNEGHHFPMRHMGGPPMGDPNQRNMMGAPMQRNMHQEPPNRMMAGPQNNGMIPRMGFSPNDGFMGGPQDQRFMGMPQQNGFERCGMIMGVPPPHEQQHHYPPPNGGAHYPPEHMDKSGQPPPFFQPQQWQWSGPPLPESILFQPPPPPPPS